MSTSFSRGPTLPKALLEQVGGNISKRRDCDISRRKDKRKIERQQRKQQQRGSTRAIDRALQRRTDALRDDDVDDASPSPKPVAKQPKMEAKPLKSILKPAKAAEPEKSLEDESEVDTEPLGDDDEDSDASDESFTISRQAAKAGLADEDAEIAALERRLGVKGSKKSLEVGDDELDWLVTGSDSEDERTGVKRKRNAGDARWLKDKRRKAGVVTDQSGRDDESDMEDLEDGLHGDEDIEDLENPFSADELSGDDDDDQFEGFSEDDERPPVQKRERENPYVAPVSNTGVVPAGKYVPPSLRKPASDDEEALKQLRRQIQGQLNRLSDANMLSILAAIEDMYTKNARQHVTMTLIDLLVGLVSAESAHPDSFLILHAGFSAALYKVVGTDFGAQLLEKVVEAFEQYHPEADNGKKQASNLISFLSSLYAFQVIGSAIMFDYIRLLLAELSETNAELLHCVVRTSGTQLRSDDPTALKDIVQKVASIHEANVSVRTKVMFDMIRDLKNNKMKAGAGGSMAAEHTTRVRKTLGSLNTRALKATEPLRITLADLKDSEKKGKWWLVGASYHDPAKLVNGNSGSSPAFRSADKADDLDAGYESDTPGHTNLTKAAKAQGMNTVVRRLIFINTVGAEDYKDAYMRLVGLKLKSKQQQEIPRVLVHCLGVESKWNPYYGLLAKELCSKETKLRKAFQFCLWDQLNQVKKIRTAQDDAGNAGDADRPGSAQTMSLQRLVNLANFFASLLAEQYLSISSLKVIDWLQVQRAQGNHLYTFAEVLLTTLLLNVRKKHKPSYAEKVQAIFAEASRASQMIQDLLLFMRVVLAKANLANGKKEVKIVQEGCAAACEALLEASKAKGAGMEDDDSGVDDY